MKFDFWLKQSKLYFLFYNFNLTSTFHFCWLKSQILNCFVGLVVASSKYEVLGSIFGSAKYYFVFAFTLVVSNS